MTSKIVVNNIESDAGVSTVFFNSDIGGTGGTLNVDGNLNVSGVVTYEDVTNIDSVGIITARKGIVSSGVVTATAFHGDGSQLTGIDATQIVTGNTSVQTVDTGSDGHVKITTEGTERLRINSYGNVSIGSLTDDSIGSTTTLTIDRSGGNGQISFAANGTVRGRIFADNSTSDFRIGNPTNNDLMLYTNNLERLRITSAGQLNLAGNMQFTAADPELELNNGGPRLRVPAANTLTIHTGGGLGSTSNERLRITSDGDVQARRARSNTTGDVALSIQPSDSTIHYGFRIDSANNNLNLDRVGTGNFVTVTFDGKMGLGTNSPSSYIGGGDNFVIAGSGDAGMTIATGTSNTGTINFADGTSGDARYRGRFEYNHSTDALDILTAASTQIRIDSSGRLMLGTLNSTGTQLIKVNGDTGGTTAGGHIALTQGRTSPSDGATHGVLSFGTETRPEQVKVVSFVDGTWTDGQYHPSGLYIATTDYNRNSPTEKIRITDIGEINCYSSGACIQAGTLQGGGYNVYFYEGRRNQNTGGTRTYIVWSNGNVENTNNSYGSISDQRLKENIVDATSQWDDIKSLQIRKYNFREATGNETHTQIGLIAQEVESVSPGLVQTTAVSEGDVLQDADGNQMESVKSINYSVLYMKSVKALQEAQTRIEALEAAVAALQGS